MVYAAQFLLGINYYILLMVCLFSVLIPKETDPIKFGILWCSLSCLCCCWLIRDCLGGGPGGYGAPPPPF